MPTQLERFDLAGMLRCGNALRRLMREAPSIESAARDACRFLYEELEREDGERACALVRCYKVHDYGLLPAELQKRARAQLADAQPPGPHLRCLTLLASVGIEPAWNDRRQSKGHQVIALPTEAVVERAPMIAQLFRALGVGLRAAVAPGPEIVRDLGGRSYGVFYVPESKGSPYIPAQDFVERYGIGSVIGFGGSLLNGDLFAIVLFTRTQVSDEVADRFRSLALEVKSHLFTHQQTFDS